MIVNGLTIIRYLVGQVLLSSGSPEEVWEVGGECCEDGGQSYLVVHGQWVSCGQGLLRLSNVQRATLFRKHEGGGCPCRSTPHAGFISASARRSGH